MATEAGKPGLFDLLPSSASRGLLFVACLLATALQAPGAIAQPGLPPGVRGPAAGAATRPVARYLGLEQGLQAALAAKDRAAVDKLLADDFEARSASAADPLARDEWLRGEFAHARRTRVRQFSLREVDDLAVASFLLEDVKADGSSAHGRVLFVVDVWRQSTGRLLIRNLDQPAHPPALPDRPSGRQ
jgi:hypothetical protein